MSSAGRAASTSGCVARPRGRETGLTGYVEQIQRSLPTGSSAMETAEHREPYESRGSRTDLGAPGGESPPGDSTAPAKGRFAAATAVRGPIPDVGRAPGRSGHGVEQRLCFLSLISGASPPNRCWPTLLPTSPERTSSSTAASSIYIHVLALGIASAAASFRRQRLSVRPYPARTCRTGPRRRYRNNLSDCGPSRSCTRHRGYFPMRPVPTEDPAP